MRPHANNTPGTRQPLDHTDDEAIALWTESRRRAQRRSAAPVYVLTGRPNLAALQPGVIAAVVRLLFARLEHV